MINWNIFDKIYCVHYLPYKERIENIKSELSRVGILDSHNFEFYYTVPNQYYNWIFWSHKNFKNINNICYNDMLNEDPKLKFSPEITNSDIDFRYVNNTNINLLINMLNLMYRVKHLGYKKILILEDDVFFLKDLDKLELYINNIPQDYNIINFDPFIYDLNKCNIIQNVNQYYWDISKCELYNASFVMLDNIAIDYILKKQEELTLPWDNYIAYKGNEDDNLKRCIPNINLSIQRDYDVRQEYYHENNKSSKYYYMNNLNMEDYNELENI